jgi:two-component sensor histidine kinase
MCTITNRDHDEVGLEDILITAELARRRPRAPDYAAENRVLVTLAREMAANPRNLPQKLVEMAVELCRAGTAGISVLKADPDGEYFHWQALAGVYAPYVGGRTPRDCSPCGITLERNAPQLFCWPARHFTCFAAVDTPIVEGLVIPFYASGRPLGTVWIVAHDEQRHFDAEDVRIMTNLAEFCGTALQVLSALEAETQANPGLRESEEQLQASLRETLAEEVGQGRHVNSALHTGAWQFRRLLEKLPAGAYTCDPEGLITYFNQHAVQLWGRAPMLNDPVDRFCGSFKLFSTDGSPLAHDQCWMALALKMAKEYNGHEILIERPDGQRLTVLAYANPIHDESGQLLGAVNVLVDISDRQRAEMALRESEARLKVALREKEILLKEIHHRVKNNLQVICSLLSLQSDAIQDQRLRDLFHDSEQRIRTMALIHETLYQASNMACFSLAPYVRRLSESLLRAYGAEAGRVTLKTHLDELTLPLDSAIPCGLILHELLSNALKHAFPDGQRGEISLELRAEPDQHVTLRVANTGVGFPDGLDFRQTDSLGLQLVCALAEQLEGTITLERHGGTAFMLTFPLPSTQAGEQARTVNTGDGAGSTPKEAARLSEPAEPLFVT